jgi:imidazole glycerol phosphate synthase subunit HisF
MTNKLTWQYTVIPMTGDKNSDLNVSEYLSMMNALGAGGWELVTVAKDTLIFKKATCSNTEK